MARAGEFQRGIWQGGELGITNTRTEERAPEDSIDEEGSREVFAWSAVLGKVLGKVLSRI